MEIYLDNSATTMVAPEVREEMMAALGEDYGNPSSLHRKGSDAEMMLKKAKERVASPLKADPREIYFTSGGTEANNLALLGGARAKKRQGDHVIISAVEHPSVSAAAEELAREGFRVTRIGTDTRGLVSPDELEAALTPQTVLVSVMAVNNEVGAREPFEEIGRRVKAFDSRILFHVDAVQAYGKIRIVPKQCGIDLLTASGHKIHGPKGIGFLYIRDRVHIEPIIYGGEQQKGIRSGTENMPGIVGMGRAAQLAYEHFDERTAALYELKEYFQHALESLDGVRINGPRERELSAPHIVSATFPGVRSEVLLHALEDKGVYASAGSACSSHKKAVSPTLHAIGLSDELASSTLRFSLSSYTQREELEAAAAAVGELLPLLRRFTRK
ncbi:MAG: cysteine desulfurase [Lachnospiraceae bacterium]|nr:cysteine desulfurase [Lachnospiraceae bacterium]